MGGESGMENEPTPPMTAVLEKHPPHPVNHLTYPMRKGYNEAIVFRMIGSDGTGGSTRRW
jgi:hypothetical protein